MPIYEYKCDECNGAFEKLVRASDTNDIECPSCATKNVTRQLSTFAARASGPAMPQGGGCPAGMCQTPGLCGRN